jgi:hypothetical protein
MTPEMPQDAANNLIAALLAFAVAQPT